MKRIAAFGRFWWEFLVGDDWVAAICVVAAIGATAALAGRNVAAWWVMPVGVVATLSLSLRRAIAASHARGPGVAARQQLRVTRVRRR